MTQPTRLPARFRTGKAIPMISLCTLVPHGGGRDAQKMAFLFDIVADLLSEKAETISAEEWDYFRPRFFGSPADRHTGNDDIRVSLCYYEGWASTCDAISVLPFEKLGEMVNDLRKRAEELRLRQCEAKSSKVRVIWRQAV